MPGFQSTRLATEGALKPFFFLYTDDSIQGNPETCKQSSVTLNYEVKNILSHELMEKFQRVLSRKSMGSVREIVLWSREMLDATFNRRSEAFSS